MSDRFMSLLAYIAMLMVAGCASTELAQVGSFAPEHQINSPSQAAKIVERNTPR